MTSKNDTSRRDPAPAAGVARVDEARLRLGSARASGLKFSAVPWTPSRRPEGCGAESRPSPGPHGPARRVAIRPVEGYMAVIVDTVITGAAKPGTIHVFRTDQAPESSGIALISSGSSRSSRSPACGSWMWLRKRS